MPSGERQQPLRIEAGNASDVTRHSWGKRGWYLVASGNTYEQLVPELLQALNNGEISSKDWLRLVDHGQITTF